MQGSTIDTTNNLADTSVSSTSVEAEHHEEHQDLRVFGLLTFLASESLMFGGLFAAYLIYRANAGVWPPEETEVELLLPTINTCLLYTSPSPRDMRRSRMPSSA